MKINQLSASRFIYKGEKTKEISFPLGGIGSGCIGLSGNGRLIDWEIFNRPNKNSLNGFSHFSIKAEKNGKLVASGRSASTVQRGDGRCSLSRFWIRPGP